jgi:hypothetical protein
VVDIESRVESGPIAEFFPSLSSPANDERGADFAIGPNPFVWTKTADVIFTKSARARAARNDLKIRKQVLGTKH